jgi:CubicO group peptidase (beta-lactamase class C family)
MKTTIKVLLILLISKAGISQTLYFPPLTGNLWETLSPASLNWCPDSVSSLVDYVGANNSKAFLVLKDGKIVLEEYYGTFERDSFWYWASAGKSLTAFLVGMAQEEGLLNIDSASSLYQGEGWTSCTSDQEKAITVKNQLCMTTGLDTEIPDLDCTQPQCLTYFAEPGTRWYYHNAPYTQLDAVIEGASGQTLNQFYISRLRSQIGMNGSFLSIGDNNVNFSTARSFARFGLLVLNQGIWANDTIMHDGNYFNAMVNSSQELNQAYGYLWWLNGKESFRLPETEIVFPGFLLPDAPADLIAAVGKNSQLLLIVPSQNLIVVRMGDEPPGINGLVPTAMGNEIMKRIDRLECLATSIQSEEKTTYANRTTVVLNKFATYKPNDAISSDAAIHTVEGRQFYVNFNSAHCFSQLESGMYFLTYAVENGRKTIRIQIE